eukprot:TRINITY_DN5503_c0_g1_i1.p1 TRINITY_DN5503_c0_g1~~TRINITY_DN5503_c0_g1_i1.p1  ORF type:complete len:291 (+),score=68.42 TRINITY_DN5503_c0_g1_i1:88-873(+)
MRGSSGEPALAAEGPEELRHWVSVVALAVEEECRWGDACGTDSPTGTIFECDAEPTASVRQYLERFAKYGGCGSEVFVLAALFLRRLRDATRLRVTRSTAHRLLLGSFVLAAKLRKEHHTSNVYYARMGGVDLAEMNRIERGLIECVKWRLHVSRREFDAFSRGLLRWHSAFHKRAAEAGICAAAGVAIAAIAALTSQRPSARPSDVRRSPSRESMGVSDASRESMGVSDASTRPRTPSPAPPSESHRFVSGLVEGLTACW